MHPRVPVALQIGWYLNVNDGGIAFDPPSRFIPQKDPSKAGKGFLSCPAVRNYFEGIFQICSPFSLRLRYTEEGKFIRLRPVYPFTSLSESKFSEFITVEPPDTWRNSHTATLQFPSPYTFFSDTPATVEQFHPSLAASTAMNWRVIPGKFDIYSWQRPLNWGIEWDTNLGDLIIRAGEPQYFVKFSEPKADGCPIELIECEFTKALEERMKLSRGITGIRKGTVPLMKKAGKLRDGQSLIKKR